MKYIWAITALLWIGVVWQEAVPHVCPYEPSRHSDCQFPVRPHAPLRLEEVHHRVQRRQWQGSATSYSGKPTLYILFQYLLTNEFCCRYVFYITEPYSSNISIFHTTQLFQSLRIYAWRVFRKHWTTRTSMWSGPSCWRMWRLWTMPDQSYSQPHSDSNRLCTTHTSIPEVLCFTSCLL